MSQSFFIKHLRVLKMCLNETTEVVRDIKGHHLLIYSRVCLHRLTLVLVQLF